MKNKRNFSRKRAGADSEREEEAVKGENHRPQMASFVLKPRCQT